MKKTNEDKVIPKQTFDADRVFGGIPSWLTFWGTVSIVIIIGILTTGGLFINLRDSVSKRTVLDVNQYKSFVTAHKEGVLKKIIVKDSVPVKQSDILAVYENEAKLEDILLVKSLLSSNNEEFPKVLNSISTKMLTLGTVSKEYANLLQEYNKITTSISKDKDLMSLIDIEEQTLIVKNKINKWEQEYLIKSPVKGMLSYFGPNTKTGHFINCQDILFEISPINSPLLTGYLFINQKERSKIMVGQKLIVKLDSFSFVEWGVLEGKIIEIVKMSNNNGYRVSYSIDSSVTSLGKEIIVEDKIEGLAQITLRKTSFFEKFIQVFSD